MPSLPCEFEVYCSCGEGICNNATEGTKGSSHCITMEPCEKCQDAKYDEGYEAGYAACEKDNNL